VVFGEVLEGFDVVKEVESNGSQSGTTKVEVKIDDSGELDLDEDDKEPEKKEKEEL